MNNFGLFIFDERNPIDFQYPKLQVSVPESIGIKAKDQKTNVTLFAAVPNVYEKNIVRLTMGLLLLLFYSFFQVSLWSPKIQVT